MPGMLVFRPADAIEAAKCWEAAIAHRKGPSTLVFARRALPLVRRDGGTDNLSRRGAYVVEEAQGGRRTVTLLATGSEVALALQARTQLQADGIATAVVSMPCWELLEAGRCLSGRCAGTGNCSCRRRGRAALRLGSLDRRAWRVRRHAGFRCLGAGRVAVCAFPHHRGGRRQHGETAARQVTHRTGEAAHPPPERPGGLRCSRPPCARHLDTLQPKRPANQRENALNDSKPSRLATSDSGRSRLAT